MVGLTVPHPIVLKELSDEGVVHRDISPGNVLLAGRLRPGESRPVGTAEGILHDVEFSHLSTEFQANQQIPVSDTVPIPGLRQRDPGSRTSPFGTDRMQSKFTSSTQHGAEMTVRGIYPRRYQ